MSSQLAEMGPVDYLVIEFPGGRLTGEGLPLLVDLADRGIIRILDLLFIRKLSSGSVLRIDLNVSRPESGGRSLDVMSRVLSSVLGR
jgi:hypothetical protein